MHPIVDSKHKAYTDPFTGVSLLFSIGRVKSYFTGLLFLLATGAVQSQPTNQNFIAVGGRQFLLMDDMSARVNDFVDKNRDKLNPEKITGAVFLEEEWNKGYVKLPDGRVAADLLIKYDAYSNTIHFLKDSTEMVLTVPVREFGYFNSRLSKPVIFRNGYPATADTDSLTYYEVMADGNFSLLKKPVKVLRQITPVSGITTYRMEEVTKLYLFDQTKRTLLPLKHTKEALLSALPVAVRSKCKQVVASKKLKLKNEAAMAAALNVLNAQ